jgi:hypothetical protein
MATIYIVLGTCGEWADHEKWNVCFKASMEEAESVRKMCQEQAEEYCKWRQKRRPHFSFRRRHAHLNDEEWRNEDQARRAAMFDKWFSWDYTGTKYYVESVSDDPAADPRWAAHQAHWDKWLADQVAEQMKHCTIDDRSPFAKLGDLIKSKLTMR